MRPGMNPHRNLRPGLIGGPHGPRQGDAKYSYRFTDVAEAAEHTDGPPCTLFRKEGQEEVPYPELFTR
jgi:hypothetical protein